MPKVHLLQRICMCRKNKGYNLLHMLFCDSFFKNWSFQFFMLHESGPPVVMTFSSFPWNEFKSGPFLQGFYSPFHQCVCSWVCPTFLLPFSPRASPERSWYFLPPTGSTYHELCQTPPQFNSLQPATWWLSQVCYNFLCCTQILSTI